MLSWFVAPLEIRLRSGSGSPSLAALVGLGLPPHDAQDQRERNQDRSDEAERDVGKKGGVSICPEVI